MGHALLGCPLGDPPADTRCRPGPAGPTCGNAVSLAWSAYLSGDEGLNGHGRRVGELIGYAQCSTVSQDLTGLGIPADTPPTGTIQAGSVENRALPRHLRPAWRGLATWVICSRSRGSGR